MQGWFPHLPILSYPPLPELERILSAYDWYFVVPHKEDPFVSQLIVEGKKRFPERIKLIYLYPSKHMINEPYYADCLVEPRLPVAENLRLFCDKILHLPKLTRSNGITPPSELVPRAYQQRIVIHPTSARSTRSWHKLKFVKLALHLRKEGYEPVLIPGQEHRGWEDVARLGFAVPTFKTLDLLARFIYESSYLIGNDSGLGHLASCLGLPTVTICRRKTQARLWAPSFTRGSVVAPYSWIPNIGGFRLRDREWKRFITVGMVQRAFKKLVALSPISTALRSDQ